MKQSFRQILNTIYLSCFSFLLFSQDVTLTNPSFEGTIRQGGQYGDFDLFGWTDCGYYKFRTESAPDIHPANMWKNSKTGAGINLQPSDGTSYLGMVVRDNGSYESITQELKVPLKAGKCYIFSVDLARELDYWSRTHSSIDSVNFSTPIVLRIWGSNTPCYLAEAGNVPVPLGESNPVTNTSWNQNIFTIKPTKDCDYITLEAFYKTPIFDPYTGHILVDNASDFIEVDCDDEMAIVQLFKEEKEEDNIETTESTEDIAAVETQISQEAIKKEEDNVEITEPTEVAVVTLNKPNKAVESPQPKKEKILKDLDKKTIVKGQKIKIKKLYFEADTINIPQTSFEVLEEVATFLKENNTIKVEIGGHTNGIPKHEYCDILSTARAKAVAEHLISLGVDPENLEYKGYGKRQPIASNNSIEGRRRNQRVELKILDI